jgi:archaellum biogenesis ATPase FlaH
MYKKIKEILEPVMERLEARYNKESNKELISGFQDLDRIIEGFFKKELIILAGNPSSGKTGFSLELARNVAITQSKNVCIFSTINSEETTTERLIQIDSKVDSIKFTSGELEDDDWKKIMKSLGHLDDAGIYIDDTARTISDIRQTAIKLKSKGCLDIIIIDSLQTMHGKDSSADKTLAELTDVSDKIKSIAEEFNVPVILNVEINNTEKPQLSDLWQFGNLEKNADMVLFIYRNHDILEVILEKNQRGSTGIWHKEHGLPNFQDDEGFRKRTARKLFNKKQGGDIFMLKFEDFYLYLIENFKEGQMVPTIKGRSKFRAKFDEILYITNSSGIPKKIKKHLIEETFKRYVEASIGDRERVAYFTDPEWKKCPDRVYALYIVALIKFYKESIIKQ